jgi:hypothetical protein
MCAVFMEKTCLWKLGSRNNIIAEYTCGVVVHFGFCETWKGSEYETHEDVGRDGLAKFQIMALISRITRGETSPQPFSNIDIFALPIPCPSISRRHSIRSLRILVGA